MEQLSREEVDRLAVYSALSNTDYSSAAAALKISVSQACLL